MTPEGRARSQPENSENKKKVIIIIRVPDCVNENHLPFSVMSNPCCLLSGCFQPAYLNQLSELSIGELTDFFKLMVWSSREKMPRSRFSGLYESSILSF